MSESIIDIEKGKEILNSFKDQAEELMTQPEKVEELLKNLEAKAKELPVAGDALSRLPLMISMIRAYIRKAIALVKHVQKRSEMHSHLGSFLPYKAQPMLTMCFIPAVSPTRFL